MQCSVPLSLSVYHSGKLLNVRDATALQISENAEIQAIKQILGLQHGKVYEDIKALRYGHLMIMTDQVGLADSCGIWSVGLS
jgi:DNA gyrase/topoisomerase IV subunit B